MLQPSAVSDNVNSHLAFFDRSLGLFAPPSPPAAPGFAGAGGGEGAQARISCAPTVANAACRVHRGLDKLKISYWVQWDTPRFLDILDFMKKRLQESDFEETLCFRDLGLDWNIQRTGTSKFTYRLCAGDVSLLFSRRSPDGTMPNLRLEIGSLTSQTSAFQTIGDIRHWLEREGCKFGKEQVSEVHLAADFIGVDLRSLGIANQDHWILRAHSFDSHCEHRKLTGVTIGRGDLMLRIYDKVQELAKPSSAHKQEVFQDLWQVSSFDEFPVTRVEYQLRRPVLREFHFMDVCHAVTTVQQLLSSLRSLWQYCTTDWSRFMATIIDRDNKHQSRALYSDFWNIVRGVVWSGIDGLRREKLISFKDIDALRKQARGCLMTIAAFFIRDPGDVDAIVKQSQQLIEEDLREFHRDETKFLRRMRQKMNEVVLDTVPF